MQPFNQSLYPCQLGFYFCPFFRVWQTAHRAANVLYFCIVCIDLSVLMRGAPLCSPNRGAPTKLPSPRGRSSKTPVGATIRGENPSVLCAFQKYKAWEHRKNNQPSQGGKAPRKGLCFWVAKRSPAHRPVHKRPCQQQHLAPKGCKGQGLGHSANKIKHRYLLCKVGVFDSAVDARQSALASAQCAPRNGGAHPRRKGRPAPM